MMLFLKIIVLCLKLNVENFPIWIINFNDEPFKYMLEENQDLLG